MVNPVASDVQDDIGTAWDAIDGTTTTIVGNLITRAQKDCKRITGTTSGDTHDQIVRYLADAFAVQNAMANLDPSNTSEYYIDMRDNFMEQAERALRTIGESLDGYSIQFKQVNP